MITGVILNWERPDNVRRIVSGWLASEIVTEIFVWNNNPNQPLEPVDGVRMIYASEDLGLYSRFAAACLARHDCILIQDDDLMVPPASLHKLYRSWHSDPEVIHGVFGRAPKPDGSYARNVTGNAEVPIVLTRVLLSQRRYVAQFFETAAHFAEIQKDSQPHGNGEDILLSYTAVRASGRLNRIHQISVTELPAPHPIHKRDPKAHIQHRTRLMQACEGWLRKNRQDSNREGFTPHETHGS